MMHRDFEDYRMSVYDAGCPSCAGHLVDEPKALWCPKCDERLTDDSMWDDFDRAMRNEERKGER